jgi:hypothetical protein
MLISILAQIAACQARVAGMQAENTERERRNAALAYCEGDFMHEANTLEQLAHAARSYR